jgi:hypothetical protein
MGRVREEDIIPDITPFHFYIEAFSNLSTCRNIGMGIGPIPYTSILDYAILLELDSEGTDDLLYFIREMDNTYLKLENKKHGTKNGSKTDSNNGRRQDTESTKKR